MSTKADEVIELARRLRMPYLESKPQTCSPRPRPNAGTQQKHCGFS